MINLLITQDILSSGPLYTGKEFDSRTRTYYFGARFFDADLGVWLTPDPAGQFFNPYAFGGDGVNYVDPDGRVAIYVNGIGGEDDGDHRADLCASNSNYCGGSYGDEPAAFWGRNYSGMHVWDELTAFITPLALYSAADHDLYDAYRKAYRQGRKDGTGLHVHAHSGGAGVSGYMTAAFNYNRGYGAVDSRTTYSGFDLFGLGRSLSSLTGTRTKSYYNYGDPVSYAGAAMDLVSPDIDVSSKIDIFNLDRWLIGVPHLQKDPEGTSVWDYITDAPIVGGMLEFPGLILHNTTNGFSNGMWKYGPRGMIRDTYTYFRDFDYSDARSYQGIPHTLMNRYTNMIEENIHWVGDTGKDLWGSTKHIGCDLNPWCEE